MKDLSDAALRPCTASIIGAGFGQNRPWPRPLNPSDPPETPETEVSGPVLRLL